MMQDRQSDKPQKPADCVQNVAQTPLKTALARPVVMIGMMGAGKTRLGQILAQKLGLPFMDSDAVIEADEGCTIAQYFEKYGEPAFRDLEFRTFQKILSGPAAVIGAGGGVVVNPLSRDLLKTKAHAVWLQADVTTLASRCAGSTARPLLNTGDPATILQTLLEKRAALYAETAAFTVKTDTQSIDDTINTIIQGLSTCP